MTREIIISATLLAAAPALMLTAAAVGDDGPAPESRAALVEVCLEDGSTPEMCGCLDDFIAERFTAREIDGAAMVFTDPLLVDDPAAAVSALMTEGYTLPEITSVVEKVMSLETAAEQECAAAEAASTD